MSVGKHSEQSTEFSGPRHALSVWDVPLMSVQIDVLDMEQKVLNRATGFFLENEGRTFLITNWHVATGCAYPVTEFCPSLKPRFFRVRYKTVARGEHGHTSVGDASTQILPLYSDEKPLWCQEGPNLEYDDPDPNKLQIPYNLDVIALPLELDAHSKEYLTLNKDDIGMRMPELGERLIIAGYPHGYSALDKTPEPIVVTRHMAAPITERPFTVLTDGIGARGMSGSPVYTVNGQNFSLFGIYQGAMLPDNKVHESRIHDFYASLGQIERAASAFAFIDQLTDF